MSQLYQEKHTPDRRHLITGEYLLNLNKYINKLGFFSPTMVKL